MKEAGFSLIELIVVVVTISALLAIGTLQFNSYTKKSQIERQMRTINADLSELRLQALYQKRARAVVISGTEFAIYPGTDTGAQPVTVKKLIHPVLSNGTGAVIFETSGLLNVGSARAFCLNAGKNPATVDSIVLTTSRIYLGKWNLPEGSNDQCNAENIEQQ